MRERLLKTKDRGHFPRLLQLLALFTLFFALPQTAWGDGYFVINTTPGGSKWVSDTAGEDYNVDNILGDGTMSYDVANNILTLNNINLALTGGNSDAYFIQCNDADHLSLTVRLIGENTLTLGDSNGFFYGANVSFITDASSPGSLTITTTNWAGTIYKGYFSNDNYSVAYCDKLRMVHTDGQSTYTIQTVEPTGDSYGLTVAGTPVTSGNATDVLGNGKVSFNANSTPVKLSFTGRNYINYPGHCINTTESIEIDVETGGNLYLNSTGDGNYPFYSANDVQIKFDSNFDANIQGKNNPAFSPKCVPLFGTYTSNGELVGPQIVYSADGYTIKKVSVTDYGITVAGTAVTSANAANITGDGTISYDADNNVLTLNNIESSFNGKDANDAFIKCTGDITSLTVHLIDDNVLTLGNNNSSVFSGSAITFTKNEEEILSTLTINIPVGWTGNLYNNGTDAISATYNNHLYLDDWYAHKNSDCKYYIQNLSIETPFTYINNEGTMMFRMSYETGCTDEVLHYSIDYVDESLEDVPNGVFEYVVGVGDADDLPLYGPCTMTYYSTAGGGTSAVGTAYYLGLATNSVMTTQGTPVAPPAVIPALSEDIKLTISETTSPASGVNPVYDSNTGLISTSATGEATCSVKFDWSENNNPNINLLNNCATVGTHEVYDIGDFTLTVLEPGLYVAGVKVTTDNASNITGDNTVSYNEDKKTLTLNDATITGQIICSYDVLDVHLIGYNTITPGAGKSPFVYSNPGTGTLTFTTNENPNSSRLVAEGVTSTGALGLGYTVSNTFETRAESMIGAGVEVEDGWKVNIFKDDLNYPDQTTIWNFKNYNLFIGGSRINSDNPAGAHSGVSAYDPDRHTLPVSSYLGYDVISGLEELIIEVSSDASINASDQSKPAIRFEAMAGGPTSGTLKFVKDENADLASITLTANGTNNDTGQPYKAIEGFATDNIIITEPLHLISPTSMDGVLNATTVTIGNYSRTFDIRIAGTTITDENAENVLGDGKVSYDVEHNILTLNGATIEPEVEDYGIWYTGTANLTISLIGNNTVKGSGGCGAIGYYNAEATAAPTLTFTNGGTEACSVRLEAQSETVIDAFTNISHDGLYRLDNQIVGVDVASTYITTFTSTLLSGGSGTEGAPFLIKTKEDLAAFAQYVNNGTITTEYVKLDDNINCSELTGFTLIGNSTHPFTGTFDGGSNTISNLNCTTAGADGKVGLFGQIGSNGTTPVAGSVSNLKLNNCSFSGGSVGGAIAGYLSYGTISGCEVTNSSVTTSSGVGPTSGGITGESNGNVTNCAVSGCTITASTTSYDASTSAGGVAGSCYAGTISGCEVIGTTEYPTLIKSINYSNSSDPQRQAGGIVGDCVVDGVTISGNSVKGVTTVDCEDSDNAAQAGAIIGYYSSDITISLTNNFYEYTVKTIIKNGSDTDERTEYEQRGDGNFVASGETHVYTDITANNGAVMYTQKVTFPTVTGATVTKDGEYYSYDETGINIAPGQTAKMIVEPSNSYFITSFTATNVDDAAISSETLTENRTRYSFVMPDAAVTVNVTSVQGQAYNLWIGETQVTSENADHILGEGNTTVTFTAADPQQANSVNTLTLNGATLTAPVKVGLDNLTVDVQGTNSITVPEGNVFKLMNDETAVTCYITFKTSTADGNLTLTSTSSETIERGGVFNYFSYRDYQDESNSYEAKFDIIIDKSIGLIQPTNSYYLTNGSEEYHVVRFAPSLGVSIGDGYGGTKVITEDNAADVFEDGTVSFDKTKNILTLNGASLSAPLSTSLATLTVDLIGDNTLRNYYDGHVIETPYGDDATVNIKSTTEDGSLTMTMSSSQDGRMVSEHVNLVIANPLSILSGSLTGNGGNNNTVVIGVNYHLTVAGVDVTSLNKDKVLGDSKITFTPSSNTLTLNGATIAGSILYNGEEDLTIALNGINGVNNPSGTYAIYTNGGSFNIMKADGATSAELTATCGDGYTPISIDVSTLGSGLYWKPIAQNSTVITDDPQFVIVDGLVMTDDRTVNGSSGTITYNSTNKILTLTGFIKEFGTSHAIKTGVTGLKVKLVGESRITCLVTDSAAFYAFHPDASIQFIKDDNTSKLTMVGTSFKQFGNNKITYDGLVYYSEDKIIAIPVPPSMVYGNSQVTLEKGYDEGVIYYTITYADGKTANVSRTEYTGPFDMKTFGTVETWVESNGAAITSTVKGKYFGYDGAPLSMATGETMTPVLIPAFEAGDNIGYLSSATPFESNNTGVATFESVTENSVVSGKITAKAMGTATLTTKLAYTNETNHTLILNPNNEFTTELTVGIVFDVSNMFSGTQTYATYYNSTGNNMTLPDGMTAAMVTGVNESGTSVTTTALTYIPKDAAVLLGKGTSTGSPASIIYTGDVVSTTDNKLVYTQAIKTTTGSEYVLYKDEFVKATGSIPVGKCYLDLTGVNIPSGARGLGIEDDGTTGIHAVNSEEGIVNSDVWYNLQGRRIEKPTKAGLYIKNGKKVIVNNK